MDESVLKLLPPDIENYIILLQRSLVHRKNMKNIMPKFFEKRIQILNPIIHKQLKNYTPFMVSQELGFDQAIYCMEILTQCKCCDKHQKRRPTIEMFTSGFVPMYPEKHTIKKCKCACRHNSRMLCREFNDEEWTDEELDEESWYDNIIPQIHNFNS